MLKSEHLVTKHNSLNDLRPLSMGLRELRFFTIYLSRINPRDLSTRVVRFTLSEFGRLMGLDSRIQVKDLKPSVELLLSRVVHVHKKPDSMAFDSFQLFKRCRVEQDSFGVWCVTIDAHDDALPLMFDLKNHFFTYKLWNTLRLRSVNQFRMYELLKQYEHIGYRVISVADLREMLGIGKDEYPRYDRFKDKVLDACKEALATHTDICYEYETYRKGAHGKVLYLKFTIRKNEDFVDQFVLDEFIDLDSVIAAAESEMPISIPDADPLDQYDKAARPLAEVTNFEFNNEELLVLDSLMERRAVPAEKRPPFLQLQLRRMNATDQQKKIKNRFKYLQALISDSADKSARSSLVTASMPSPEDELKRLENMLAKQSETYGQTSLEWM